LLERQPARGRRSERPPVNPGRGDGEGDRPGAVEVEEERVLLLGPRTDEVAQVAPGAGRKALELAAVDPDDQGSPQAPRTLR
ncbi:MAG TPA: hypothetical protein VN083_10060, partial [Vicinamibacteria bacterium]|nr:hypothetical protein [Vicinamibacteria bacterium]